MPDHFRFRGTAIGAAGRITEPFHETIEVQAATALPAIGGYGVARSSRFRHREILRFEEAYSEVIGTVVKYDEKTIHTTLIKTTLEGFDVMGMVTADRVVANLVSGFSGVPEGEPEVGFIGSHFENLRIAGIPVDVDLAIDVFDKFPTYTKLREAYRDDPGVRGLFGDLLQKDRLREAPKEVSHWFHHPAEDNPELPEKNGITTVSLVRKLEVRSKAIQSFGHVIHAPGFGTIRLAEMEISRLSRGITMVQIHLGCPVNGDISGGVVEDGCSPS